MRLFSGRMLLPPSTNQAYKIIYTSDGCRIGPTQALEQFKSAAGLMLNQAYCDRNLVQAIQASKRKVPLEVKLQAYLPTAWKRDLDGVLKFAIDAAFEQLGLNDNLVVRIEAEKFVDAAEPRVEIEIRCVVR